MKQFNLGKVKGDKGDRGDTGAKGDQGIQGIQGLRGDKGEIGITPSMVWGDISGDIISQLDLKGLLENRDAEITNSLIAEAIPRAEKGAINGVASLGIDGKVTPTQLPTTGAVWGNITGSIADQVDLGTAATKNVGTTVGQIPLAQDAFKAAFSEDSVQKPAQGVYASCNDFPVGSRISILGLTLANAPPIYLNNAIVETISVYGSLLQRAYSRAAYTEFTRMKVGASWSGWLKTSGDFSIHEKETLETPNVVVDSNNQLKRSAVKTGYVTATVAAVGTLEQTIALGIATANILNLSATVYSVFGDLIPAQHSVTGYFFDWYVNPSGVFTLKTPNAKNGIAGGTLRIYITYT